MKKPLESIILCEEKAKEMKSIDKKNYVVCKNDHHKDDTLYDRILESDGKRANCNICSERNNAKDTKRSDKISSLIEKAYTDYPEEHKSGKRICSHKNCVYRNEQTDIKNMFMPPSDFICQATAKETTQCSACRERHKVNEINANRMSDKDKCIKYPKIVERRKERKIARKDIFNERKRLKNTLLHLCRFKTPIFEIYFIFYCYGR